MKKLIKLGFVCIAVFNVSNMQAVQDVFADEVVDFEKINGVEVPLDEKQRLVDDTTYIQGLIDATPAGGICNIPSGDYTIKKLEIGRGTPGDEYHPMTLVGNGTVTFHLVDTEFISGIIIWSDEVTIDGFHIIGAGATDDGAGEYTGTIGIVVYQANNVVIRNNHIESGQSLSNPYWDYGFAITVASDDVIDGNLLLENNMFEATGLYEADFLVYINGSSAGAVVNNNVFKGNPRGGLAIDSPNVMVSNNTFEMNGTRNRWAMRFASWSGDQLLGGKIVGNLFRCTMMGKIPIVLQGANAQEISNNTFQYPLETSGLYINSVLGVVQRPSSGNLGMHLDTLTKVELGGNSPKVWKISKEENYNYYFKQPLIITINIYKEVQGIEILFKQFFIEAFDEEELIVKSRDYAIGQGWKLNYLKNPYSDISIIGKNGLPNMVSFFYIPEETNAIIEPVDGKELNGPITGDSKDIFKFEVLLVIAFSMMIAVEKSKKRKN